jgi:prepilin-type N-terminal cleavage/methylation domain-containing protein
MSLRASHPRRSTVGRKSRRGFTLIELMITISIIALMAGMMLFALYSASETAKTQKTKALIAKLDAIIKAKYESYKTRRVPVDLRETYTDSNGNGQWDSGEPMINDWNGNGTWDPAVPPQIAAKVRLDCLRDLMRMEMPDRLTDVNVDPVTPIGMPTKITRPSTSRAWKARFAANPPTPQWQSAECLYMIVMQAQNEEADDRSVIKPDNIGDADQDGYPEFIDAWGTPISFLRWAPGFISELQAPLTAQVTSFNNPGANTYTITAVGTRFSSAAGSYIGGTIAKVDTAFPSRFDAMNMARITGYTYTPGMPPNPPTIAITCTANSLSMSAASPADSFVIMSPDPFDPRKVYPIPGQPEPTWAIYPLIYSDGPNRYAGILSEQPNPAPAIQYATPSQVNPFLITSVGLSVGATWDDTTDPRYVPSGWLDNIHNHMITAK